MAQGPSDTILVAIRITRRIRESKVRNPDPPDRRRFVLSEHSTHRSSNVRSVTYQRVDRRIHEGFRPTTATSPMSETISSSSN